MNQTQAQFALNSIPEGPGQYILTPSYNPAAIPSSILNQDIYYEDDSSQYEYDTDDELDSNETDKTRIRGSVRYTTVTNPYFHYVTKSPKPSPVFSSYSDKTVNRNAIGVVLPTTYAPPKMLLKSLVPKSSSQENNILKHNQQNRNINENRFNDNNDFTKLNSNNFDVNHRNRSITPKESDATKSDYNGFVKYNQNETLKSDKNDFTSFKGNVSIITNPYDEIKKLNEYAYPKLLSQSNLLKSNRSNILRSSTNNAIKSNGKNSITFDRDFTSNENQQTKNSGNTSSGFISNDNATVIKTYLGRKVENGNSKINEQSLKSKNPMKIQLHRESIQESTELPDWENDELYLAVSNDNSSLKFNKDELVIVNKENFTPYNRKNSSRENLAISKKPSKLTNFNILTSIPNGKESQSSTIKQHKIIKTIRKYLNPISINNEFADIKHDNYDINDEEENIDHDDSVQELAPEVVTNSSTDNYKLTTLTTTTSAQETVTNSLSYEKEVSRENIPSVEHYKTHKPNSQSPFETYISGIRFKIVPTTTTETTFTFSSLFKFDDINFTYNKSDLPRFQSRQNQKYLIASKINDNFETSSSYTPTTIDIPSTNVSLANDYIIESKADHVRLSNSSQNKETFRTTIEVPKPQDVVINESDLPKPEPDLPQTHKLKSIKQLETLTTLTKLATEGPRNTSYPARVSRVNAAIKSLVAFVGNRRPNVKCSNNQRPTVKCNDSSQRYCGMNTISLTFKLSAHFFQVNLTLASSNGPVKTNLQTTTPRLTGS